ncbi:hypothetical protein AB833_13515 [Chromatiales bacterium (ex Bugula neritina AB1)]|nr:hypothetical protein AB833_13515 [Chromatiales bacterium (ex Bugula neritina AB1)]
MDERYVEAAFALLTRVFIDDSPPHRVLNVKLPEYRDYLASFFFRSAKRGYGLVALDCAKNVHGCVIGIDYCDSLNTPDSFVADTSARVKMRPLLALLAELDLRYRKHRLSQPGDTILVDMAAVSKQARGAGVYVSLRLALHECAKQQGYRYIVGELSSAATRYVCIEKFHHRVVAEINYDSFEYDGDRPFRSLIDPPSLVMVEGFL